MIPAVHSAPGAALEQHLREFRSDSFQYALETQHIPVRGFTLSLRRQQCGANLGHVAVHIPLHIGDRRTAQHIGNPVTDSLADIGA